MRFKLVVTDFDWTLGVVPGVIEESTVETIKEYQKRGGIFCICSGRKTGSVEKICDKYNLACDIIGYQGAEIKLADKTQIFSSGISKNDAISVAKEFIKRDKTILYFADDELYASRIDKFSSLYQKWNNIEMNVCEDTILQIEKSNNIRKMMCMCEPTEMLDNLRLFRTTLSENLTVNSGAPGLIEVVDSTHDKGNAVQFLANYYKIPLNEVMTVGDSLNDMSLIGCGGYGVAVGNACDDLKKFAEEVTIPFEQKPVEHLIKKYCLD